MLKYGIRIDVSKGINTDKADESRGFIIYHFNYFPDINFKLLSMHVQWLS